MALFRPAPKQRQKKAPAASGGTPWYRRALAGTSAKETAAKETGGSRTGTKGGTKTGAKGGAGTGTTATSKAKTGSKAKAAPASKGASKAKTAPNAKAAPKSATAPGFLGRRRAKSAPKKRTAPRGRRPRPPVLQRDSIGPTLARAAVMAVALVCMVGFAVALAKVTLVPSPASDSLVHTNLKPGASIRAYLDQPTLRDSVKQVGGNVLLGVPFGVLLPMLFPRARGLLRVVVLTALVMILVEAAQGAIVEGRAFDIDDVILNTLGALLGYLLLGRRLGRALHPRRDHWWHRYGLKRDRPPARTRP